MKLYMTKIPSIAHEVVQSLVSAQDIEVNDGKEAQLDVEAVLKEYVRLDREVTDRAKDQLEEKHLDYGQFGKIKRGLAEEKNLPLGDEAVNWMANQILEGFMQSAHVDEVFADDVVMRKKVKEILRKHTAVDDELDQEVRRRIKNLEEGTATWDLEYSKVMDQIRRKHGIKE